MNDAYKKQVGLLLDVLPEVAKESCFAMHGGTAINLFVRDMPRLSVDIDLTYVPIEERGESLKKVNDALIRIKERVEAIKSNVRINHKENVCKLQISDSGTQIKIEVNMVGRGLLGEAYKAPLCDIAQEEFDAFCAMTIVPMSQLYGGKICAALDRQHPRDLLDIKLLLDIKGFTSEIKKGLVSSHRPTHELLKPSLQDQRTAFDNQFEGMSVIDFSYEDYEQTRLQFIERVKGCLTNEDKACLLSVNQLEPDWGIYHFQNFPSVKWKLSNLEKFRDERNNDYQAQYERWKAY
ncbi:nucleotidyltransferase [Candidatus Endobugula sertula]|uniref:Nucleotidyltransferase n=1 Tax=Candidatus Endobugula sertula TaxID=62101 RepID=A0A1D2QS59_9GAMM|nr:nucleotidyltransferase [Candidatus Endobugula sertula]